MTVMRFTSLALLSVFLITFVLASRPVPDPYSHFKDPGCHSPGAYSCLLVDYCKRHRKQKNLYQTPDELKSRNAPEPEILDFNLTDASSPSLPWSFTKREPNVKFKRQPISIQCGIVAM